MTFYGLVLALCEATMSIEFGFLEVPGKVAQVSRKAVKRVTVTVPLNYREVVTVEGRVIDHDIEFIHVVGHHAHMDTLMPLIPLVFIPYDVGKNLVNVGRNLTPLGTVALKPVELEHTHVEILNQVLNCPRIPEFDPETGSHAYYLCLIV